ncbi:hypothetical protein AB9P05_02530 [Roseivirga sp. BDSF3-8]|uniref:hypothetical protein n=1 Tax=Roseivirga sp. BDSF3-8 TaxID=3241598 RepID=UPI0035318E43
MKNYLKNQTNKLLVITGVFVAALLISMACESSSGWQAHPSGQAPIPFGSTIHKFIVEQPTAWLFQRN